MFPSHLIPRAIARLSPKELEQNTLRFPPAILTFLREIQDKEAMLNVFYDAKHFFISHLFEVAPNRCIIDAPPSEISPPLRLGVPLQVMGTVESIPFYFAIDVYTVVPWDGYPAFRFAAPQTIIRIQRRSNFRLHIPIDFPLKASYTVNNEHHEARVADISTGGIRLTDLPPLWLQNLSRGQIVSISVELDGIRFRLPASVTNAQRLRFANGRAIGQLCLQFVDLPPQIENHIARFLMKHETLFAK